MAMNRTRAYRRRQVRLANVILFLCGAVFGFLDLIPFSLLCILGILGNILWTGTSLGEGMITEFCKKQGDTLELRHSIDHFLDSAEVVPGIWLNAEYFAGIWNGRVIFGSVDDLVWIYTEEKLHSTIYFEPLSRMTDASHTLVFCCRNQKKYYLRIPSKAEGESVLDLVQEKYSHIMTGYSKEKQEKYSLQ